jgi:RHS repeat-associated protein
LALELDEDAGIVGERADEPINHRANVSPETGLQYLQARFYDPATGQFLSRDPLQELTRQPYSYAGDDPLNLVDPSGMSCSGLLPNPIDCASEAVEEIGEVIGGAGELATGTVHVVEKAPAFAAEHADVIVPVGVTAACVIQPELCPLAIGFGAGFATGANIARATSEPCFDFVSNEAGSLLVIGAAALPGGVFDAAAGRITTDVGLTSVKRRVVQVVLDAPGTGLEVVHARAERNARR